jgi:hypothetical protein
MTQPFVALQVLPHTLPRLEHYKPTMLARAIVPDLAALGLSFVQVCKTCVQVPQRPPL